MRHHSPIPVGFWRSVGASLNTFAVESLIDELAKAAGQDPYQFRRNRLSDPRWLAVLDAAAGMAGWSSAPASGTARGIAIGKAFNTIVAAVVEVRGSSTTSFSVPRVWLAVDSYLTVNPAQMIGGVIHCLNATLYGQQIFVNGVAQRRNSNTTRLLRAGQAPQVAAKILPPAPGAGPHSAHRRHRRAGRAHAGAGAGQCAGAADRHAAAQLAAVQRLLIRQ